MFARGTSLLAVRFDIARLQEAVELGRKTGAYEVETSREMDAFTAENLAKFDAVLFNNTTRLAFSEERHRKALMDFLERGGGLIGVHSAKFPSEKLTENIRQAVSRHQPEGCTRS